MEKQKVNRRKEMKRQQERGTVEIFLQWLNQRDGSSWVVESEPDPPDAIIRDGDNVSWVEVASVFPSDDYAHDTESRVTPGEKHYDTSGRTHKGMTASLADRFVEIVAKKRRKVTYLAYKKKYSPGILLLDLHSPWFGKHTVEEMCARWESTSWSGDLGCFKDYFVVYMGANGVEVAQWFDD